MKVEVFESAIDLIGLEKKEVRLEKNQVKWFICGGNSEYDIIVFDAQGKALVLSSFAWPEEVNDVHIETYRDKNGQVLGVTINGVPVMRDDSLDLNFEEEDKPVPGLYVEETTCPYPEAGMRCGFFVEFMAGTLMVRCHFWYFHYFFLGKCLVISIIFITFAMSNNKT